jgi:hypothetical protein
VKPQLQRVGTSESPVVIIDGFAGDAEGIACIADSLAPFPPIQGNYYPGVRRMISQADRQAYSYVLNACERAAPFIGGAFGVGGFDLHEARFSLVTTRPDQLQEVQRRPHFDSSDQNLLALLHYLRVPPATGTAFYRHRSTGIERINSANLDRFLAASERELETCPPSPGYMAGSDDFFEQIAHIQAVPDRLIIYHGSLLHSGVIPTGMNFSPDPRQGRLTANLFVIGRTFT